jgi:23S rRNA (guanine745-N1)-methyltransferase
MVDLAGGTGHLLAALLTSRPERHGILLELSTPALRAAARAHSRIAAIGTDLSNRLPIADATAGLVVSSFGPRPADEIARVLHPDGRLLVVTPGPDHLRELRGVGDVTIDPSKASRLDERLAAFPLDEVVAVRETREVERAVQLALIGMGPSAFHSTPEQRAERAAVLPDPLEVTIDVRVARYRAPRESVAGGPEAEPT